MTIATQIRDSIIPFQVGLERVKAGQQRAVLNLMKNMEKSIYGDIMASNLYGPKQASYQALRLKSLLISTNKAINEFATSAHKLNTAELKQVAKITNDFMTRSIGDALGTPIVHGALTPQALSTIVSTRTIEGAPAKEWWGRQSKRMKNRFADRIRLGFARGDSTGAIVSSIRGTNRLGLRDGIMKRARHEVTALVRTSVQSVSNETNLASFKDNPLIEQIQWSATFDGKTTDICIGLDGQMWDANTLEPVGSADTFPGPIAHWQCRSVQIPVLIKWEKLAKKNKKVAKQLDKKLSQGTKQSMHGPVDKNLTYESWLRKLEKKTPGAADAILGKKKADLWRKGALNFRQLLDETARPISALELGVDPIPFDLLPKRIYPEIQKFADKHKISFDQAAIRIQEGWTDTRRLKVLGKKKYDEFLKRKGGTPPTTVPKESLQVAFERETKWLYSTNRGWMVPDEFDDVDQMWAWIKNMKADRLVAQAAKERAKGLVPSSRTFGDVENIRIQKVLDSMKVELPHAAKEIEKFESFIIKNRVGSVFANTSVTKGYRPKTFFVELRNYTGELLNKTNQIFGFARGWSNATSAHGFTHESWNFVVTYAKSGVNMLNFKPKLIKDLIGDSIKKYSNVAWQESLPFHSSSYLGESLTATDNLLTWIHEMGHNVFFQALKKANINQKIIWEQYDKKLWDFLPQASRPLTRYAMQDVDEYWAENFVYWLLDREAFMKVRPTIVEHIDDMMEIVT